MLAPNRVASACLQEQRRRQLPPDHATFAATVPETALQQRFAVPCACREDVSIRSKNARISTFATDLYRSQVY
jgi:hypothetical protein